MFQKGLLKLSQTEGNHPICAVLGIQQKLKFPVQVCKQGKQAFLLRFGSSGEHPAERKVFPAHGFHTAKPALLQAPQFEKKYLFLF